MVGGRDGTGGARDGGGKIGRAGRQAGGGERLGNQLVRPQGPEDLGAEGRGRGRPVAVQPVGRGRGEGGRTGPRLEIEGDDQLVGLGWGGRPPVGTAVGPEERSVGGRTATEGRGAGRPPSRTRLGGGPAVPLREVETMNKIHPDHPHSPTPSLATVPKVNKNALFPTIFTSRDQLVRPRRPAAPPFPGPPTRPRWLLYHPNRPLGPARTGAGTDRQGRGGTWRGTGRRGATARSTGRPPPATTTGWSTDRGGGRRR